MRISRRHFLGHSMVGAAATSLASNVVGNLFAAPQTVKAWTTGMQINPDIDNTKVVCCFDTAMIKTGSTASTFSTRNTDVVTATVETNMDTMAMRLAVKDNPADAWATIFRKPSGKEWNQTNVAIKVNCIYTNMMPLVAIVGKVCTALISLGIPAANITIYDACSNAYGSGKYNGYVGSGLPSGIVVSNVTGDGTNVPVGSSTMKCASVVTACDILVNCAINKGHTQTNKGGFTLTMKNHTGTMKYSCPSLTEMIDQNKSETIIARQQLCIVDCLWSAKSGPGSNASHVTNRIVMGTFGPLVDIAVARKIREPLMSATHTESAIGTILSSFGYTENDIQWDEFTPGASAVRSGQTTYSGKRVSCTIENGAMAASTAHFILPADATTFRLTISNLKGSTVRVLTGTIQHSTTLVWDGKSVHGRRVRNGNYVVTLSAGTHVEHGVLSVRR